MSTYRLRKAMKLVGRAGAYTERPLVTQAEDGTPLAFFVGMGRTAYMDCCNWAQLFCTGKPGEVCGPTISYPNGTTASGQY
jgi:hypothetical protein